jgi:hypothetical protein
MRIVVVAISGGSRLETFVIVAFYIEMIAGDAMMLILIGLIGRIVGRCALSVS